MKVKKIYWFTILETIITVVIIGLLIGVIFQIFVVVGRIAVFVQQQRQVHNEMIYVIQILQNLIDDQAIVLDMSWYWNLEWNFWYAPVLRLVDTETDLQYRFSNLCEDEWCYINLEIVWDIDLEIDIINVPLTSVNQINIEHLYFKILPFLEMNTFETTMHQWFWMFIDARSPIYDQELRWNRVFYRGQLFFNQRKY